ncbi:MAG: PadR family transcriptional regulator [Gemmatimonadales bacterium]|nr:PadR family transcriptional regulator [Gemmatimonadales bacterium]
MRSSADFDIVVLAAVAQLAPEAYGVTIRDRVGLLQGGRIPSVGAVYTALQSLERGGLLRAQLGDPSPVRGGRAKRFFSLSAKGVRELTRAREAAQRFVGGLTPRWKPS